MKEHLLFLLGAMITLPTFARDFDYTYEDQTVTYTVIDEVDKTVMTKESQNYTPGNIVSGSLVLPSVVYDGETKYTLTKIGDFSFFGCGGLVSVEISSSVTSIGDYAFGACSTMTDIKIGNSVKTIGKGAISGCRSLTSVEIPNLVVSIGDEALMGCFELTEIMIGSSLTTIGTYYGLGNSRELERIIVSPDNSTYSSLDGVLYNKEMSALIKCPSKRESLIIPTTVTAIGKAALEGCRHITSLTIPNSVTTIGDYAFLQCYGLTSIVVPNSVTIISEGTFSGCEGLISIVIPNSVTTIGNSALSVAAP